MEYNKNDIANYIGMQIYKIRKENKLSRVFLVVSLLSIFAMPLMLLLLLF